MASEIKVDTIVNAGGDNDSGIDLSTNDIVAVKTANSERMRVASDGKVGIGTTSGTGKLTVQDSSLPKIQANYQGTHHLEMGVGSSGCGFAMTTGHFMTFNHQPVANAGSDTNLTERMRINDDGALFINHASNTHPIVGTEKLGVVGGTGSTDVAIACNAGNATGVGLFVSNTVSGAVDFVKFSSGSGGDTRGLIEFDGSNMTYGGTSDYRLKENVATYTKGIETLKKLNPIAFTWKESKASDVGFLAHEVAEVHPSAVSGDKDGMETVAGEEKIRPQMLDPSKLVGILTGALQEAVAKIETLEAKVTALESK